VAFSPLVEIEWIIDRHGIHCVSQFDAVIGALDLRHGLDEVFGDMPACMSLGIIV
jgi:hypothetical protein